MGKSDDTFKTSHYDEKELLSGVLSLYNGSRPVELDPCYSIGRLWKGLTQPRLKFDLVPVRPDVAQADCRHLPLAGQSISSILFDPPFLIGGKSTQGIMDSRFSSFRYLEDMQEMYGSSLLEFARVLKPNGLLIFKCQDQVHYHKQFLTHVMVISEAERLGFFCHECLVLSRKNVVIGPVKQQQHARKNHCYYLVLEKDGTGYLRR